MQSKKVFAIVVSEFNDFITKRLLDGCLDELRKCGIKKSQIAVTWVPGAFEIPLVALKLAKKKKVAFLLRPFRLETVFKMAHKGCRLQQKSTYFYPKVLSGVVMRRFKK